MLIAVGMSIYLISDKMNFCFTSMISTIKESEYSQVFFWEGKLHFWKQFLAGVFIAIVMTGLDQDMMQKNLSCRNTKDAQKNMYWFAGALVVVNLIFLFLGALLYMYAEQIGITQNKDELFPMVALHGGLGITLGIFFILGLIAAAYSSADSALTSLTTSFCVDILDFEKEGNQQKQIKTRKGVHLLFSIILVGVILIIKSFNDDSVIDALFQLAGYTYGPLLGMYAFGLFTQFKVKDKWVPILAMTSPFVTLYINLNSKSWFNYVFSFELLILNGFITFIGLYFLRTKIQKKNGVINKKLILQ